MNYRQPKGPGSIHGWTTQRARGATLIYGARPLWWAALAVALAVVLL